MAILAALAERLRKDPQFMAHVLSTYKQLMGVDDNALARELCTQPEMMVRLALCKSPDVRSASYDRDVRDLSEYTLADERALSQVIRRCGSPDGGVIPVSPAQGDITKPWRLGRWSAALLGSPFRSALTLVCSVGILLIVGSILLWRQSMNVAPPLVAAVPSIDAAPTGPPKATESNVLSNGSEPPGMPRQSGDPSTRAVTRRQQSQRPVMVNLEQATLREAVQAGAQAQKILRLPLSRNPLLLRLVEGSRPGEYLVSVRDAYLEPVFSIKKSSPQGRFLKAVVDTRGMLPGEYSLCVQRESKEPELPDCVPMLIDASRRHIDKLR